MKMFVTLYENLLLLREPSIEYLTINLPQTYGENWWELSVLESFKKNQTNNPRPVHKKIASGLKTLHQFDFHELLDIFIFTWEKINTPNKKIKNLFHRLKAVRNDVSHPDDDKLSSAKFKSYIKYIIEFSKLINIESLFVKRLSKYVTITKETPKNNVDLDEKRIKLLELIENKVIGPALECENLSTDVKESLTRTLIRFEIAETVEDIDAFFKGALGSSRGEAIYNILHDNNLITFENIRDEFNEIYLS
jgi:hypothetical protein